MNEADPLIAFRERFHGPRARVYRAAGCTAGAIENMHDRADFVRVEGFVLAHVADEEIAPSARSE